MKFVDLEGIVKDTADKLAPNERAFLSKVTRGSEYGPSDIFCIGFAETDGGEEDEFSKVFWTSRGSVDYQGCPTDDIPDFIEKTLCDMKLGYDIEYDYKMDFIKQMIADFGTPPRFINLGSEKHPYVLVLYVREPEGQAEGKSEGNGGEWGHLRTGPINFKQFF